MAVDSILKNQYSDNIAMKVQQTKGTIAATVYQKPCSGEVSFQEQIAKAEADEKLARNEIVRNTDPDFDRRKIVPRTLYMAPLVDKMDKLMMLKDPTSEIVQTNAAGLLRKRETIICEAFHGTAYSGKAGTTSNSLSGTSLIASSSVGMNMTKIRSAKKALDENEVELEDRYLAMSAEQVEDLLATTEATSIDYATVKALASGQLGTICGFKPVQTERLPVDSSDDRKCVAYHKNGLVLGIWDDLTTSIDILPTVHFSAQVYASQSYGATRLEEERVIQILCAE
jgi:hypothetical protein